VYEYLFLKIEVLNKLFKGPMLYCEWHLRINCYLIKVNRKMTAEQVPVKGLFSSFNQ